MLLYKNKYKLNTLINLINQSYKYIIDMIRSPRFLETPISKTSKDNWMIECSIAEKNNVPIAHFKDYSVPTLMIWDGICNCPNTVKNNDMMCFVLSAFDTMNMPIFIVIRDTNVKPRKHWKDRKTSSIELKLIGFLDRNIFCNKFNRKLKTPMRTMWCKQDKTYISKEIVNQLIDPEIILYHPS